MAQKNENVELIVKAQLLAPERAEELPKGVAYAFSHGGRLLGRAELDRAGSATIALAAAKDARAVRVLVGPALKEEELRIAELLCRGAEELITRIEPGELEHRVDIAVIPDKWLCWLLSICFVPGTLLKREQPMPAHRRAGDQLGRGDAHREHPAEPNPRNERQQRRPEQHERIQRGLVFRTAAEANNAATFDGRPFGGLLRAHLEFDNGLREDLGLEYYRVSWRQGTSGPFQPLTGEVHRHYSHEPPGDATPVFEVYSLGPQVVGSTPDLFEIPPALPPKGQWVVADLVEDQTNAKFPTETFAPAAQHGKYQLKIDLFDASGNLVDIDALSIIYVLPEQLDLSGATSINTENASVLGLVVDEDGDGKKSFIMTLHVDNNECTATVDPALLSGPANPCGVLEYDPANTGATVTMPYVANHPNGFATYRFRLKRRVTTLPAMTESGTATPPGNFAQSASASDLLGGCPVAAFSEILNVWALAINGWSRLQKYDAFDHAAFVLSPEENEDS